MVGCLAAGCPEQGGPVVPDLPPPPRRALCEEAVQAELPRSAGQVLELAVSSIEGGVLLTTLPDAGDPVVTVYWRSKGWAPEVLEGAFSGAFSWDGQRVVYATVGNALRTRSIVGEDVGIVDEFCDFKALGDTRLLAVRSGDCGGATLPGMVIYGDAGGRYTPLGREENVRSTFLVSYDAESRRVLVPVWGGDRCECGGPTSLAEDLAVIDLPLGDAPTSRTVLRGSSGGIYGWLEDGRALLTGTPTCGCSDRGVRAVDLQSQESTSLLDADPLTGLFTKPVSATDLRHLSSELLWSTRPRIGLPIPFVGSSGACMAYGAGGVVSSGVVPWNGAPITFGGLCEVVGSGSDAALAVLSDAGVLYQQHLATAATPSMLPYAVQAAAMRRRDNRDPWALPVDGEGVRGVVRLDGPRAELISAAEPFYPATALDQGRILGILGAPTASERRLALLSRAGAWTDLGPIATENQEVAVDDQGCVFAVAEANQIRIVRLPAGE